MTKDDVPTVEVRRVYDHGEQGAGHRVLVDRLWPRGVAKRDFDVDEWATDVAPSTELRRWYGHDVARFEEFARRDRAELRAQPAAAVAERLAAIARERRLTLLTATRDVEHSGAEVLRQHLVAAWTTLDLARSRVAGPGEDQPDGRAHQHHDQDRPVGGERPPGT
jgi:uncharacterized protein YeaO (DUF488 family)